MRLADLKLATVLAATLMLGLGACNDVGNYDVASAPEVEIADGFAQQGRAMSVADRDVASRPGEPGANNQPPTGLQSLLAYRYNYAFALPVEAVRSTAQAHTEACLNAGPSKCQVLQSTSQQISDTRVSASINLRAEPEWLKSYAANTLADVEAVGGDVTNQSVSAEDLTNQIIDTGARLDALTTLRDRLQNLLATRDAKLPDLLTLERELARVQGEIDATTARLASLRARVSMSIVNLSYQTKRGVVEASAFSPIGAALRDAAGTFASGVAAVIYFVMAIMPFLLFVGLPGFFLVRWLLRRRKREVVATQAAPTA